jgi:hypothetical protein
MIDWLLSLVPWWIWGILALIVIAAVQRLVGWRAALTALAAVVGFIAYRKGRDDASKAVLTEVAKRQEQSQEKINEQEQGALDAGRAAADRVRREAGLANGGDDRTG